MKTCLRLFLVLCLLLAISKLSATDSINAHHNQLDDMATCELAVPFIDLLEVEESYHIEILSISCFNGSKQTLEIFRDVNGYFAHFEDTIKEIGSYEIDALRDFELTLRSLAMGGCSTVDTYTLIYGAQRIRVSDGTCSFNGGQKLMKQLGFIPGK